MRLKQSPFRHSFPPKRTLIFLLFFGMAGRIAFGQMRFVYFPSMEGDIRSSLVDNSLNRLGVQIMPYGTPEFNEHVVNLLSEAQQSDLSTLLPESAIVCNSTGRYIWGFTVIYRYPDKLSPAGRPWEYRFAISPGGAKSRSRMLAPNGCYLSTPVADIASSYNPGQGNTLPFPSTQALHLAIADHETRIAKLGEHVQIILDSVIFENGEICGPDSALRMKAVNDRIRANEDFVSMLSRLSGETLRAKLQAVAKISETDDYSFELSDLGLLFLAVLNHQGEDVAVAGIHQMQTTKWFPNSNRIWRSK